VLARRFDLIVVRGPSAAEFMKQRGLGRRIEVVPGSIDTRRFSPNGEYRPYDVVTVSRLVPYKQPEHLLEILIRLRERRPGFRALIVGDGPLLEALKAQAAERRIADCVEFKGHVENVERYLRESKIFVLTSKSEGLSIAMAEAMAAGAVPVVADVGDLGELVDNGKTGWRISPGGFDEYADRIDSLLRDSAEFRRCSQAARVAVVAHSAVESIAGRWCNLIENVCGTGSAA